MPFRPEKRPFTDESARQRLICRVWLVGHLRLAALEVSARLAPRRAEPHVKTFARADI
jgi:hypothetical protein